MERGDDGDAMDAWRVFHFPENFAGGGVEHIDFYSVRNVQTIRGILVNNIVKTRVAGDGITLGDFESRRFGGAADCGQGEDRRCREHGA
jgi:hypothetical protein